MFIASLGKNAETRTTYADEATGTSSWRINWLNGDMINVYTPQGETGFQTAPYKVVNTTEDGADDNTLNYAKDLVLVNDAGVRWGSSESANFYAIYPYVSDVDNFTKVGTHTSIKATINANQVNSVPTYTSNANNIFVKGDMPNNVMYANTLNVDNGTSPVNLRFVPASTVLQFKLGCLSVGSSATGGTDNPITIQSITVTSPTAMPIAGTLFMNFENVDNVTDEPALLVQNGENSVTLNTQYNGMNVTIPAGGTMTANVFIAVPSAGYDMSSGWTITVKAMEGTFTKELTAEVGANSTLKAGQIHQINLPKFNRETEWTYSGDSWLSTIPDNVYLSELSLPGAWYAYDGMNSKQGNIITGTWGGNEGYQENGETISDLFTAGVRAFQFETRVGSTNNLTVTSDNATVVISATGKNQSPIAGGGYYAATSIDQSLKDIAKAVDGTDEFAVAVISYVDGTSGGTSATWRKLWLSKLKDVIDDLGVSNIFSDTLSPNITLKAARGKLIILVCVDSENEKDEANASGINALYAYTDQSWVNMDGSLISQVTWKGWPSFDNIDSTTGLNADNVYLNYTLANRTYSGTGTGTAPSGMPTLQNRKDAINSLIANSDVIYGKSTHNLWILCGAGGTYAKTTGGDSDDNGPENIANDLNPFLAQLIDQKIADSKPSPLGLVLVNQITNDTYSGPALIKAIIEMNNKFYLQRDENATDTQSAVRSLSSNHASAFSLNSDSWTAF